MLRIIGVMINYINKVIRFSWTIIIAICLFGGCRDAVLSGNTHELATRRQTVDYIRAIPGQDEDVADEVLQRGKVLISYSDCYICHKEQAKVTGPAFSDIALRYPRNDVFIGILAQRVILGGTGAWGNSVMSPHPTLSDEDARAMVSYILSVGLE